MANFSPTTKGSSFKVKLFMLICKVNQYLYRGFRLSKTKIKNCWVKPWLTQNLVKINYIQKNPYSWLLEILIIRGNVLFTQSQIIPSKQEHEIPNNN